VAVARISDVARIAGVSTATVSRVLTGQGTVSDPKSARVWAAVEELGYHANRVARRLRAPGKEMWALIVPDIENQFFTSVARGVEDVASELGITVFIGNTDYEEKRLSRYIETALSEQVGGIILAPGSPHDDISAVVRSGVPLVLVDQRIIDSTVPTITSDHYQGGSMAGTAMRDFGYHRIAVIAGPVRELEWNARLQGLTDAFEGTDHSIVMVERADNRVGGGREAMARILDGSSGAEAVFVTNNLMTIGALREFDARRMTVPGQFGIVGYDLNSATLSHSTPITTVNQDPRAIGREAARTLVSGRIGSGDGVLIKLPPVIVLGLGPLSPLQ